MLERQGRLARMLRPSSMAAVPTATWLHLVHAALGLQHRPLLNKGRALSLDRGPRQQRRQITSSGIIRQGSAAASPYHHQHHQAVPFYGYSPAYIATDISYNHKLSYTGGSYMNGHFSQVYPGQAMVGANTLMPMYPLYHFHQSQAMGLPAAHIFPPNTAGPMTTVPTIMSKPPSMAPPNAVCLAVE
ncbi:RNA-BINDING PROTEIN ARP1 ISOFORM X1-RELATED [Salix koriyanagi]|uniref:RNA-BINDING PROTEIN ARP1 ISOFORM X1-RELATED n=1 Tax=Salix koriyanagi TaxID=2511006 RepID=A0A9Q0WIZ2_9ROSI|nr:RNA-BINDING PROTEIN ARP1 ISOFORM X1-RELATED [Salix koriyanagi]